MKTPAHLFTAWMGPGPMSSNRSSALIELVTHCSVPIIFITKSNYAQWISPTHKFHPAFELLSAVHQCDYLRCYLLHVHGGGYSDIKPTKHNWIKFFNLLSLTNKLGAGYTEIAPHGVARVGGELEIIMQRDYQKLIGLCSLIIKPQTSFSLKWLQSVNKVLDENLERLRLHPAQHPQDHYGLKLPNGDISRYPLSWTGVGGDIFHPLVFEAHDEFNHFNMAPIFNNYR